MTPTLFRSLGRVSSRNPRVFMRGGTVLGLIVGIVIGLAVALGVAMYVAKVPIPFVNNAPVSNAGNNAAEDQKNQNWNPNATLQTHGPALSASDAESAPPPQSQPQQAQPQKPVAVPPPVEVGQPARLNPSAGDISATQPDAPARPAQTGNGGAASDDALGDFAAAHVRAAHNRGNASASASAAADAPFTYFVQTGAFRAPQEADAERARLSLLGMEAAVTQRDDAGRPVYRVRVGPLQNKAAADQIKDRLTRNGFEAALVRVPR